MAVGAAHGCSPPSPSPPASQRHTANPETCSSASASAWGSPGTPRAGLLQGWRLLSGEAFTWLFFSCFLQPVLLCAVWQVTPACGCFKSTVRPQGLGSIPGLSSPYFGSQSVFLSVFKSVGECVCVGGGPLKHRICSSSIQHLWSQFHKASSRALLKPARSLWLFGLLQGEEVERTMETAPQI